MSEERSLPPWNVTMLGPSRVGKTSLLTALRIAGDDYFAGTPVSVEPENEATRAAFNANDNLMKGELASRKFSPDALPGDLEAHQYGLVVDAGVDSHQLILRFLDYPGGWLSNERSSEVKDLLADSPTVIVPIDATLLMEGGDGHSNDVVTGLRLTEVKDKVRFWAKQRAQKGDLTRLILAPVKCESYFKDNGGRRDKADALFGKVQQHYAEIVSAYRDEAGTTADVLYAPVDTIGPIDLMEVEWEKDEDNKRWRMRPTYRVRSDPNGNPKPRQIKGAEPILAHLASDVIATQDEALRQIEAEKRGELSALEKERARRRSNWFKKMVDNVSGRNEKRKARMSEASDQLDLLDKHLRQLSESITPLSTGEWSRVRPWT